MLGEGTDSAMNYQEIKELIEIFEKTDLNDMEVTLDNARIRLNRGAVSPWMSMPPVPPQLVPNMPVVAEMETSREPVHSEPQASQTEDDVPAEKEPDGRVITAPIVGTFYQSAAPGEEPFVKPGDQVKTGDVVCIIEAMKFMNEVNSEISGTITEILVNDGDFVEYGQELFRVK